MDAYFDYTRVDAYGNPCFSDDLPNGGENEEMVNTFNRSGVPDGGVVRSRSYANRERLPARQPNLDE